MCIAIQGVQHNHCVDGFLFLLSVQYVFFFNELCDYVHIQ